MSVKSGQVIVSEFVTENPATGAAVNADSLPTAVLTVNGVDNAAGVTVASKATGEYTASVTLPSTMQPGQVAALIRTAVIGGVQTKQKIWEAAVDTERVSDLNDVSKSDLDDLLDFLLRKEFLPEWEVVMEGPAWWTDIDVSADGQTIITAKGLGPAEEGWDHGVFLSKDGGATWTQLQFNTASSCRMSGDGQTMLVGASGDGLYQSLDGGDTWTKVAAYTANWASCDVSTDGSMLIASQGSGIHYSPNGGVTWYGPVKPGGDTGVFHLCGTSADGSLIVAGSSKRLWMSEDRGSTWVEKRPYGDVDVSYQGTASVCYTDYGDGDHAWDVIFLATVAGEQHLVDYYIDSWETEWTAYGFGTHFGLEEPWYAEFAFSDDFYGSSLVSTSRGLFSHATRYAAITHCRLEPEFSFAYALATGPNEGTLYAGLWGGDLHRFKEMVAPRSLVTAYDAAKTAASAAGLADLEGVADRIKVKTDTISAGKVTVTSPVSTSGDINIFAGNDYYQSEGRSIPLDIPDPTHLYRLDEPGAVVQLRLQQATWEASQVIATQAGYTAHFQPSDAETRVLTRSQPYQLHCTSPNGHEFTLHEAMAFVAKVLPAVV
ncbi:MAG: hypothetical protein JXA87_07795 [Thermoleophilia bacterium]|nr:hypothetical protein [Thermoleophilia bacterium]